MATVKVVTSRLFHKLQIKDKLGVNPVVAGCTTFFELDNQLHAIMSSVEGGFTSKYRMKTIKATKDIDGLQGPDRVKYPGFLKIADIAAKWNGKEFPIRFSKEFIFDDVSCFSAGVLFGAASYLKNKTEINPRIESTSVSSPSLVYPISKLDKALGNFLIYQRKLAPVTQGFTPIYGPTTTSLETLQPSDSAAFAIPYVWRRFKQKIDSKTKVATIAEETFVGAYDHNMKVKYEDYVVLNTETLTYPTREDKAAGLNVTKTNIFRQASIPRAVNIFQVQVPSNDIMAVIDSNMEVSTQRVEDTTRTISTDYIQTNVNPSIFFFHNSVRPYTSQFDETNIINKKYLKQEFKNFANRHHILMGHFDTKVIDSKSAPIKTNLPVILVSGADYGNSGRYRDKTPYGTLVWQRDSGVTYYNYYGYYGYYDAWRNTYSVTTTVRKETAMSEMMVFSYAKGVKPHDLIQTPKLQRYAMWDRYFDDSQDNWAAEPLSDASSLVAKGFIKHAPVYQYDAILSSDKKTLYVFNTLADTYNFNYFAFGARSEGVRDRLHKAWAGLGGAKALTEPGPTVNGWSCDDTDPELTVWEPVADGTGGYHAWHSSNHEGNHVQDSGIPATLPSRKLYVDVLDVSAINVQIKKSPLFVGQGRAKANGSKCPLSTGKIFTNPDTGISTLPTRSGNYVNGGTEDTDAVVKCLDFKVVYMKKRVFVARLMVAWSGPTYLKCIGAFTGSKEGLYYDGGHGIREFTMNYPDTAWIELWELNLALGEFGHIDLNTKAWISDQPVSLIDIGYKGYALPVIHEAKGAAKKGYNNLDYGPTLDEISTLEDFAKYKGEFLHAIYTSSGFIINYSPHNKYGKNIYLYTAAGVGNSIDPIYYEARFKDTDAGTNYMFAIEGVK